MKYLKKLNSVIYEEIPSETVSESTNSTRKFSPTPRSIPSSEEILSSTTISSQNSFRKLTVSKLPNELTGRTIRLLPIHDNSYYSNISSSNSNISINSSLETALKPSQNCISTQTLDRPIFQSHCICCKNFDFSKKRKFLLKNSLDKTKLFSCYAGVILFHLNFNS